MNDILIKKDAEIKPTRTIKKSLSYVQNPIFNDKQLVLMLQKTPEQHIKNRKGRGGQIFRYHSVSYVTMRLNQIFGWSWSFEMKSHGISPDDRSVFVEGRLSVFHPTDGRLLVSKEQFGGADLKYQTSQPDRLVDYADDLKAAASDALKKCASLLGIGSDLYADPATAKEIDDKVALVRENMLARQAELNAEAEIKINDQKETNVEPTDSK